jgi:hypothetical protein
MLAGKRRCVPLLQRDGLPERNRRYNVRKTNGYVHEYAQNVEEERIVVPILEQT